MYVETRKVKYQVVTLSTREEKPPSEYLKKKQNRLVLRCIDKARSRCIEGWMKEATTCEGERED